MQNTEKSLEIRVVESKKDIKRFIDFQYDLYKEDSCFVPPLRSEMTGIVTGTHNALFEKGPYRRFMVLEEGRVAARIIAGVDENVNRAKGSHLGYIALFECIQDYWAGEAVFNAALGWLKEQGVTHVKGPVSPTGGDDYRGLLIEGFDQPPVLMNAYHPSYYKEYFEAYGFTKDLDLYAFFYDVTCPVEERRLKAVEYAMKRYNFTVDCLDMEHLDRDLMDVKQILDIAMPEDWEDMVPPSIEEIRQTAQAFKKLVVPEFIRIARSEGKPIGFSVALPNYNEALIKIKNGRLFPLGFRHMIGAKKRIRSGRIFILFVIPEFRKKGVSGAILFKTLEWAYHNGYQYGEGSTIGDVNESMVRDAEGAGGERYKVYRIYGKDL